MHLRPVEFSGEGDVELPGELGVFAPLCRLDGVPQSLPVVGPIGGVVGGKDDGGVYPSLLGVVKGFP